MLEGRLEKNGDWFEIDFGKEKIMFDGNGMLDAFTGSAIIAGIRPEDIKVANEQSNPQSIISARVELVESLGSESYLHLSYNGMHMTARVLSETALIAGSTAEIELDTRKLHLFDAASGEALL